MNYNKMKPRNYILQNSRMKYNYKVMIITNLKCNKTIIFKKI